MVNRHAQGRRESVIAAGSLDISKAPQHASKLETRWKPEEEELSTK